MRRLAPLLLVLALAACAGPQNDAGGNGPEPGSVTARFQPGGANDVIQVVANDRLALRTAELIAPDGSITQAYNIDTRQAPRYLSSYGWGPSVGVGIGGGSGGFGTGIGLSLPMGGAPTSETWSGQTLSNAFIRIPDPVGYRQNWQAWKVRVRLGDPPDVHDVMLDAPAPPP